MNSRLLLDIIGSHLDIQDSIQIEASAGSLTFEVKEGPFSTSSISYQGCLESSLVETLELPWLKDHILKSQIDGLQWTANGMICEHRFLLTINGPMSRISLTVRKSHA